MIGRHERRVGCQPGEGSVQGCMKRKCGQGGLSRTALVAEGGAGLMGDSMRWSMGPLADEEEEGAAAADDAPVHPDSCSS